MIFNRVPATGEGISVSTLSVDTSSRGSSTATSSPTFLSQRVTVPSVTDSPSAGNVTRVPPPSPPAGFSSAAGASSAGASSFSDSGVSSPAGSSPVSSTICSSCSAFFSDSCSSLGCASGSAAVSASPAPSPCSPTTASTAPTSTVASSSALISSRVPATGEGISVSTLSVETSSSGSSTATVSPTFLSQRVTVPSVTDSPRAGRVTSEAMEGSFARVVCGAGLRVVVRSARAGACRRVRGAPRPGPRSGSGGRGATVRRRRRGLPSCRSAAPHR